MPDLGTNGSSDLYPGGATGRYLVLFEEGAGKAGVKALAEATGVSVATVGKEGREIEEDGAFFEQLGVAVVSAPPDQIRDAGVAAGGAGIIAIEPERIVHALDVMPPPAATFPG